MSPSADAPFYRSAELWLSVLVALLAAAGAVWLAAVRAAPGEAALLDLRDFRIVSSPSMGEAERRDLEALQTPWPSQRPFATTLLLPRPPRRGDFVAAETTVRVPEGSGPWCFSAYVTSPYYRPGSPGAVETLTVSAFADGRRSRPIHVASSEDRELLVLEGIEPGEGRLRLGVEVRAHADRFRESWRRASRVTIEYADLWRCR